jgi:hypothetical protein
MSDYTKQLMLFKGISGKKVEVDFLKEFPVKKSKLTLTAVT